MALATAAVAASRPVAESNVLVPALGETIIGLIAFGLLCAVLMKVAFPRIEAAYQTRREAIEGGIARAEQEQAKARAAYEQYTAQLATAREEAGRIRDEARRQAQQIADDVRAQAQSDAARITAAAESRLAAERGAIVAELRREIGTLAVDLAERVLGSALADDARQRQLVDDFLAGLEASPTAAAAGEAR